MSSSRRRIMSTCSGPAGRDAQCRRGIASRRAATVPVPLRSERSRQSICMCRNASSAHSDPLTYDFGFIKTARPFQGLPGVFPLAALTDVGLRQVRSRRFLHIAGYPCDKPPGDHVGAHRAARSFHAAFPLLPRRHAARDRTEVRSGCGVIVPARSAAIGIHAQRAAGISTRANVRPARRYRSRPPAQPIGACGSRAN